MFSAQVSHRVTYGRSLSGHTYGVGYLSWSHDDKFILACGTEEGSGEIWLWNAQVRTTDPNYYPELSTSLSESYKTLKKTLIYSRLNYE